MQSANISQPSIAVIFSGIPEHFPFGHFHQLVNVGILNIYIVLNDSEYQKANSDKFILFSAGDPKTILEHYQEGYPLKFSTLNAGDVHTEGDKLNYFFANVKEEYSLTIFLHQNKLNNTEKVLTSSPPIITTTSINLPFFLFSYSLSLYHAVKIESLENSLSDPADSFTLKLLSRESNPCICYRLGFFDLGQYQWLMVIFARLISIELNQAKNQPVTVLPELSAVLDHYRKLVLQHNELFKIHLSNNKIIESKKAYFESTECYRNRLLGQLNDVKAKSLEITKELMSIYHEIIALKNERQVNIRRSNM